MDKLVSQSRLNSLYKDFRPLKELNFDGYVANVNDWQNYLLKKYFPKQDKICVTIGTRFLQDISDKKYGAPASIDVVIDNLIQENILIKLDEFKNSATKRDEKTITRIFSWIHASSIGKLNRYQSRKNDNATNYLKQDTFVIRPLLEEKFTKIYDIIRNNILAKATTVCDLIFPLEDFIDFSGISYTLPSDSLIEWEVMLNYLEYHKNTITRKENIVKIIDPLVESIYKQFGVEITETDQSIAEIKQCFTNIENAIEKYEIEVYEYKMKLKGDDFKKITKIAQTEYKRGYFLAQKMLLKLFKFRNNLVEVKYQLDMSVSNLVLYKTLQSSNKIITTINGKIGPAEKVHDLLEEIRERSTDNEEITKVLSMEISKFDDDELDEELKEMEKELAGQEISKTQSEKNKEDDESKILEQLENLNINNEQSLNVVNNNANKKHNEKFMLREEAA